MHMLPPIALKLWYITDLYSACNSMLFKEAAPYQNAYDNHIDVNHFITMFSYLTTTPPYHHFPRYTRGARLHNIIHD